MFELRWLLKRRSNGIEYDKVLQYRVKENKIIYAHSGNLIFPSTPENKLVWSEWQEVRTETETETVYE